MNIEKIKGHSYYMKGGTNTGIYMFKDKFTLVIDPGLSNSRGNRLIKTFNEDGMRVKYIISTHEHSDHYGATSALIKEFTGAKILSSKDSKLIIDNNYLFGMYTYGGKTNRLFDDFFKNRGESVVVDEVLTEGEIKLSDKKFQIYDFSGHSPGQIGVMTEDKVLYLGDSLFNESILEKYNFPYLYSCEEQLKTLEKIKSIDFDYAVLAHGKGVIDKAQCDKLVDINIEVINKYLNQIMEFLETPYTREELMADIIQLNDLKLNYKEYHFSYMTLGGMISYLVDVEKIEGEYQEGKIYYYVKK